MQELARAAAGAALALSMIGAAQAQNLGAPLDVTCSRPIEDGTGAVLKGRNPAAQKFGLPMAPGTLVQVLDAGPNGVADLPAKDGAPGGDDVLFASTVIGQGIAPNLADSGRFAKSFHPPPAAGSRVYVRAFNSPTAGAATRWGQSLPHVVHNAEVLDASVLGLWATTQPLGTDPRVTDSDADGLTDYEELVANTNAGDAGDTLRARAASREHRLEIDGKAGRSYRLLRSRDDLRGPMNWTPVAATAVLTANERLVLADPEPTEGETAFYRVEAVMP